MSDATTYIRRAVVQGDYRSSRNPERPKGTIAWAEHVEAWEGYNRTYYGGNPNAGQSAERIHDRGGFGYDELVTFLGYEPKTWEPR